MHLVLSIRQIAPVVRPWPRRVRGGQGLRPQGAQAQQQRLWPHPGRTASTATQRAAKLAPTAFPLSTSIDGQDALHAARPLTSGGFCPVV